MDEILKTLAEAAGINPETAKNGLGAVLAFIKEHIPAELFGEVQKAMPEAQGLASNYEQAHSGEGGGLMGAIAGLAGKVLGGGAADVSKLFAMLGKAGLSMDQVQKFLPTALDLLKKYLPPETLDKILKALPGLLGTPKGA